MGGRDGVLGNVEFLRELAQARRDQHILRGEVPIQRHLVGARRLGNRLDAHGMDAAAIEQLTRGRQDALARGQTDALPLGGRSCG